MKKTLIALMTMACMAVATDESPAWTISTNGTYNGTEGAAVAGLSFILSNDMSSRVTIEAPSTSSYLTSELAIDSITLTTRGGKDVTGEYSMYIVDSVGTLVAVAGNTITLDTNNVATEMNFSFTTKSAYGSNASLTLGEKYSALLVTTSYMTENWTNYAVGDVVPGGDVNSIQLAMYSYGNETNSAEWIAAGASQATQFPGFAPIASVTVHSIIPEPATATLSLLALAGLAARRRRK